MKTFLRLILALGVLCGIGVFGLLAWSTGNASRVAQYQSVLLWMNAALALALFVWVVALTVGLIGQLRRGKFGARLTARFALAFALIGVLPGALIYTLSVQFMSRSIESWFNVRVDAALESGLALGRAALESQLAELDARARAITPELNSSPDGDMVAVLTRLREAHGLTDVMVFTGSGRIIAFSTDKLGSFLPRIPPPSIMNQLRITRGYSAVVDNEELTAGPKELELQLRVIVPLRGSDRPDATLGVTSDQRWLQVVQPVAEKFARNASEVQAGYNDYQELALSRRSLRNLFGVTLTLAWLLAVFAAIAVGLYLSRRLVSPLLTLASGTHAVSVGDYRPLPESLGQDEVGQLTRSFNAMTRQLDEARRLVESNRQQLERSNVYLESVLSNLSAGVLVFDEHFRITTFNEGAQTILGANLRAVPGRPLETVDGLLEFSRIIRQAFAEHAAVGSERMHWQEQFEIVLRHEGPDGPAHTLTLLARGTNLRVDGRGNGFMVVFDDITEVISANRSVAWAEVARRLAHEIKNPLTPIQLSAERLLMKLANKLDAPDAQLLERATTTIVNQVNSLKHMVDDFREYARKPPVAMEPVDLNDLVGDVLTLYGWNSAGDGSRETGHGWQLDVSFAPGLPHILGDPMQLRQVIHNLLANARDALGEAGDGGVIHVTTQETGSSGGDAQEHAAVRLTVSDNGSGFSLQVLQRAFEPYVTTKTHGTGLGLAIVRKIIEEHDARIDLSNRREGGARVSILFTRLAVQVDGRAQDNDNAVVN